MKTRVFDLAPDYGYKSDYTLAPAMGLSRSMVGRVRNGTRGINPKFIEGALRAFPDKTQDDLFYTEDEKPIVFDIPLSDVQSEACISYANSYFSAMLTRCTGAVEVTVTIRLVKEATKGHAQ